MSEMLELAEELREYTAMKYAGDCKCGKCQLVPRALVERIYHTLNGSSVRCSAVSANDWREDPSSDERWNAGCDFALERLCGLLGVNPKSVSWDAATETVEGDVSAVIGNILCAKYGEDWGPSVELGFTDVLSKRIGWLRYAMYNVEIGRCRDARECAHEALHIDDVVAGKTTIPAPAPLRTEPQTAWICAARKQALPEPAECNWPDCGCDPHAMKVIESLIEQGWSAPRCQEGGGEYVKLANEHLARCMDENQALLARIEELTCPHSQAESVKPSHGIYIASKTKHAHRWLEMRAAGVPIISTWIDEAGEGESADLHDLWDRCISESKTCHTLIVYREPDDILKGAWVEIGAALGAGVPVYAAGLDGFTISKYRGIKHFQSIEDAFDAALTRPERGQS